MRCFGLDAGSGNEIKPMEGKSRESTMFTGSKAL